MNDFEAVNILDAIEVFGENKVDKILSDFSCKKNREIEIFVKKNAVEFAKKKMSVTYLVFDTFNDRYSLIDNTKYIQLFKFI